MSHHYWDLAHSSFCHLSFCHLSFVTLSLVILSLVILSLVICLIVFQAYDAGYETPYVANLHNCQRLAKPQKLFTFHHPNWNRVTKASDVYANFHSSSSSSSSPSPLSSPSSSSSSSSASLPKTRELNGAASASSQPYSHDSSSSPSSILFTRSAPPCAPSSPFRAPFSSFSSSSSSSLSTNERFGTLTFPIGADATLHGFCGYFHATLYGKHFISILPDDHTDSMFSW